VSTPACRTIVRRLVGLAQVVAASSSLAAGQPLPPPLESRLRAVFGGQYDEQEPGPIRWLDGGRAYARLEPVGAAGARRIVRCATASGECQVVVSLAQLTPSGATTPLSVDDFGVSADGSLVIATAGRTLLGWMRVCDAWLLTRDARTVRPVAREIQQLRITDALSPDGTRILFARQHDLYVQDVRSGRTTRLTHDGVPGDRGNGVSDWGGGAARWSPDGSRIAYLQSDSRRVGRYPIVESTESSYPEAAFIRLPMVGTPIVAQRLGVVGAGGGATRWIDVPVPAEGAYLEGLRWTPDSRHLLVERMARSKDHRSLLLVDPTSGEATTLLEERDPAWVDFDRDGGNLYLGNHGLEWLGRRFTWLSERDGWRRVHMLSREGIASRALTPAGVDVVSVARIDARQGWLYYMASPDDPTRSALYRVSMERTVPAERLTPETEGTHEYDVSPDARWAIHRFSTTERPTTTELVELPSHRRLRVLEDNANLQQRLDAWELPPVEFLELAVEGAVLDAWMLRPRDFDPGGKYPVVVFVYGATAPTVVDAWDFGLGRGLFHRALSDAGYVVVSIDNRGTHAPKGAAWRRAVFGRPSLVWTDQAAGVEQLARLRPYLDLSRVAIWGFSAGGTNTLSALFRRPDLYRVGIAVAAHSKAELANAWYQETFLRTPAQNPAGYQDASPLNFAEGLRGDLLLIHGSADDVVVQQSMDLLVNRLIELQKPFDAMVYPGRRHGLDQGPGNTRLHLHSLIARYLLEHLPPGPH
jgi:dipeptidyl-peptidase-4